MDLRRNPVEGFRGHFMALPQKSDEPPSMKVSLTRKTGLRAEASGRFGIGATAFVVALIVLTIFGLPH